MAKLSEGLYWGGKKRTKISFPILFSKTIEQKQIFF